MGPPDHRAELDHVRLRVAAGADPGDVDGLDPRTATVIRVASDAGAPLLTALDAAADAADDARRTERAVEVAAAQGRAVATGLALAPIVLVPLAGRLFGVDLVAYHRTPLGWVTGGIGVTLLLIGVVAARRAVAAVAAPATDGRGRGGRAVPLVLALAAGVVVHPLAGVVAAVLLLHRRARRRVAPTDPRVADAAELAATAVAGGVPVAAALRLSAAELPALATDLRRLAYDLELGIDPGVLPPGLDRLADVLTGAERLGAPVGPTLRRLAADVRADELTRVLAAAERLPVQLTFPTALCLLPGSLLLIGAPIVRSGLAAVGT